MLSCLPVVMGDRTSHKIAYASYATTSQSTSGSSRARPSQPSPQLDQILSHLSLQSPANPPFEDLDDSEYLLLLTPYLHAPPPHLANQSVPMDPFEPFGRSLATHHANIRHVPYVARNGMVELHEQVLDDAGAVIVVICKPPTIRGVSSSQRLDSVKHQQKFAKAVSSYLENELGQEVPGALVTIDAECKTYDFDASYILDSWTDLDGAADTIFGQS